MLSINKEIPDNIVHHEGGVSFFCDYEGGIDNLVKIDDETIQEILAGRIKYLDEKLGEHK